MSASRAAVCEREKTEIIKNLDKCLCDLHSFPLAGTFMLGCSLGHFAANAVCRWLRLMHYLCGSAKRPLIGSQVRCNVLFACTRPFGWPFLAPSLSLSFVLCVSLSVVLFCRQYLTATRNFHSALSAQLVPQLLCRTGPKAANVVSQINFRVISLI